MKTIDVIMPHVFAEADAVGKYKTWTPGPWTPSMDRVHGRGPSKYGPGPWTPFMDRVHGPPIMDRVHGPPIFTTTKKISKFKKMNSRYYFKLIVIKNI